MTQLSEKVALVTGASSGLGAAVAQLFADRGASMFGIARDSDYNLIMRIAALRGMMAPDDVAKTIAFLASDDAAAVHGAVYLVDNGKTAG